MRYTLFGAAILFATSWPSVAQVPPPPAAQDQEQVVSKLIRAIETKDVALYASLLSTSLQVFEDGTKIASSKNSWLSVYAKSLSAAGVTAKPVAAYSAAGRLLLVEYFDSTSSWGTKIPSDCCQYFEAVSYEIRFGEITVIRRLKGGDVVLDLKSLGFK